MTQKKIIQIAVVIGVILVIVITGLFVFGKKEKPKGRYTMDLEVWGVFDNSSDYSAVFDDYAKLNPHIEDIEYKKFTIDKYKKELINALAADKGPDIFMIKNTWLPEFEDKIVAVSPQIITEKAFDENFVEVVSHDAKDGSDIYAVPMSVDSLALYYNKDIFNSMGIISPPTTWEELSEDVKLITRYDDESNQIIQSGIALGTAQNINSAADILTVLMMQGGAEMSRNGIATFNNMIELAGKTVNPAERALQYYTQFGRVTNSKLYTWNDEQHYSLDAFAEGKTAMMINYSWQIESIKHKNEKLNFAVAPLPQTDAKNKRIYKANYANYWMFVVAKDKKLSQSDSSSKIKLTNKIRIHEAWQFIKALTFPSKNGIILTDATTGVARKYMPTMDYTKEYLDITKKPAARLDLIKEQRKDPVMEPFVLGNLIAKNWYHPNADAVERIIANMITQYNSGEVASIEEALGLASQRINNLMR